MAPQISHLRNRATKVQIGNMDRSLRPCRAKIDNAYSSAAVGQRLDPGLEFSMLDRRCLLAERILIDCDNFTVHQDRLRNGRHAADVIACQQR